MAASIIPYGQLAGGNYGVLLDPTTGISAASVVEVLSSLPPVGSTDNFTGRMVFDKSTHILNVFVSLPTAYWKPMDNVNTIVGNVAGSPPVLAPTASGQLYWDKDTSSLFVWDGLVWKPTIGQYATQIFVNTYTADGVSTSFPSGASTTISNEYMEIFLDGVRQVGGVDYNVVGTTVVFVTPPANGVVVHARVMVANNISQTSQVANVDYVATPAQINFTTSLAASDPAGVFVYKNGILQTLSTDYTLVQQNVSIISLIRTSTVATVTTVAPHNMPIGTVVTLVNFIEPIYNNRSITITSIPTATTFTFTTVLSDPVTGTSTSTAYYTPSYINDTVRFVNPLVGGEKISIRSLRGVVVANAAGEVNTLGSVGTGTMLAAPKTGVQLNVKSLVAGANVSFVDNGTAITISAAVGGGVEDRLGTNSASIVVANPTSYVGVQNSTSVTNVDISGIVASGRRIIIKDEAGTAGTFPLNTITGGGTIDGQVSPYVISTNFGSVSLVSDGANWFITAARP